MQPKVYLETSFVSYLSGRLSQDLGTLQRQLSSRTWWEERRNQFEMVASEAVFQECRHGDPQAVRERTMILEQVALLPLTEEILELARQLIRPGALPESAGTDAIHIAAATAYGCDYLLTWNFKHINNARIKRRAIRIIQEHGYEATTICTPDELMGSDS